MTSEDDWKTTFLRCMLFAAFLWAFMFGQMAEQAWHITRWLGL